MVPLFSDHYGPWRQRRGLLPLHRSLIARWLQELRFRGIRRARTDAFGPDAVGDFESVGLRRALFQGGRSVRLTGDIPRWAAVGDLVALVALLRRGRAHLGGGAPADAVSRLLWTAAVHDDDHWGQAFFRRALLWL